VKWLPHLPVSNPQYAYASSLATVLTQKFHTAMYISSVWQKIFSARRMVTLPKPGKGHAGTCDFASQARLLYMPVT
jgi:hypothetical protein